MTTRAGSRRDDYVRLSLMTVGDVGLVGGLISWILGWRFGHLLVTLSLILLIAGLWPGRFRLRKSVAGGHLLVGRGLKGEEALGQARTAAHHYRKLAAKHPDEGLLLLATTLDWQRSLLQNLGKHAEAVPVAREAVESWREVVTTDPTRREDLSKALNRLTVSLSFPVHQEEAISLTAEAIDVQRSLVAAQEELLAQHLSNLANGLHNTGQWEAELPVVEEAATLYRRLVPGNRELLPQAADNAEELGTTLRQLDRLHEASTRPGNGSDTSEHSLPGSRTASLSWPRRSGCSAVGWWRSGSTTRAARCGTSPSTSGDSWPPRAPSTGRRTRRLLPRSPSAWAPSAGSPSRSRRSAPASRYAGRSPPSIRGSTTTWSTNSPRQQ